MTGARLEIHTRISDDESCGVWVVAFGGHAPVRLPATRDGEAIFWRYFRAADSDHARRISSAFAFDWESARVPVSTFVNGRHTGTY